MWIEIPNRCTSARAGSEISPVPPTIHGCYADGGGQAFDLTLAVMQHLRLAHLLRQRYCIRRHHVRIILDPSMIPSLNPRSNWRPLLDRLCSQDRPLPTSRRLITAPCAA